MHVASEMTGVYNWGVGLMVEDHHGETYVAFLDISGFKRKVRDNVALAASILDKFYGTIYNVCSSINREKRLLRLPELNIIVASDCAVVFSRMSVRDSRNNDLVRNNVDYLTPILSFVKEVNRILILSQSPAPVLTTCSIAHGDFIYEDRREFGYLKKNCFLGTPYMSAFQDNENLRDRPGYCRLVRENLHLPSTLSRDDSLSLLHKTPKYYYFYWMLSTFDDLKNFRREYKEACRIRGQSKYIHITAVLQKYVGKASTRASET